VETIFFLYRIETHFSGYLARLSHPDFISSMTVSQACDYGSLILGM